MTNKKVTRRALLMSVTSLLICISMLLGTTFAWFTDEVTSGVNRIIAGNLDVELYHSATTEPTGAESEKVTNTTKLFEVEKWEPGVIVYENFLVKNVGTLAFKYHLNINVDDYNSVTVDGVARNLKEVLKVYIGDGSFTGTRTDAQGLTYAGTLAAVEREGTLLAGTSNSEDPFSIVIYWEPNDNDVDNVFNINNGKEVNESAVHHVSKEAAGNKLFVDLGINLVATQVEHEYDSFDNEYDKMPAIWATTSASASVTTTNVNGDIILTSDTGSVTATIPDEEIGGTASSDFKYKTDTSATEWTDSDVTTGHNDILTLIVEPETITSTSATYEISLVNTTHDEVIKEINKIAVIELYIGAGLLNVSVKHSNVPMTEATTGADQTYTYDGGTGKLTIYTSTFSPFEIKWEDNAAIPTADVQPLDVTETEGITLWVNNNISDQAKMDKAFVFNAFSESDYEALNAFIDELCDVTNKDSVNLIALEDFENAEAITSALDQMEDSAQKARIQVLLEERVPYLNWRADFEVSFDRNIAPGTVALGGYYRNFAEHYNEGAWIGFGISDFDSYSPTVLLSGKSLRLLDTMYNIHPNEDFHMNYAAICMYVQSFSCGFANLSEDNCDATMTVKLCLYELDGEGNETGTKITCGEFVEKLGHITSTNTQFIAAKNAGNNG